jgi:hypothetical protein
MPTIPNQNRLDWSPRPDFDVQLGVTHSDFVPATQEELGWWLEDTSVLPEAEVYRDLDKELYYDIIRAAAERIFIYLRSDDYKAPEATEWYLRKQTSRGLGGFGVQETEKDRTVHYVDRAA